MSENIVHQPNLVSREERWRIMGQRGLVCWFTGLSGSGKSTIAVALERRLADEGRKVCLLDGDNLRAGLNADLGFSAADRQENIRRTAHAAKLLADSGLITLVSCITPFQSMRDSARALLAPLYFEVYVKAGLDTCRRRDPKGLYGKNIANFTGSASSPYEAPLSPDLVLDTETSAPAECVDRLYAALRPRFLLSDT